MTARKIALVAMASALLSGTLAFAGAPALLVLGAQLAVWSAVVGAVFRSPGVRHAVDSPKLCRYCDELADGIFWRHATPDRPRLAIPHCSRHATQAARELQ